MRSCAAPACSTASRPSRCKSFQSPGANALDVAPGGPSHRQSAWRATFLPDSVHGSPTIHGFRAGIARVGCDDPAGSDPAGGDRSGVLRSWRASLIPLLAVPVFAGRHVRHHVLDGLLSQYAVPVRFGIVYRHRRR
ncbi:hypothetical protein M8494_10365 [Serratia ureilytica]